MHNPFVAQFPVSSKSFIDTLSPKVGQKFAAKHKFAAPTPDTVYQIKEFLFALHSYEDMAFSGPIKYINDAMADLRLNAIRLLENPNVVVFYPNDTKETVAIKCGCVLTWDFSVQTPLFVFDPHSHQLPIATVEFLNGAKVMLSHVFDLGYYENPKYQPGDILNFTDPLTSKLTAFTPFCANLFYLYPEAKSIIVGGHGKISLIQNFEAGVNPF